MLLIVPTTPTIVYFGLSGPPRWICWPSALRLGKYFFTRYSSTTTTPGEVVVSPALNSRPATSGIRIALKYSPPTISWRPCGDGSPGAATRPTMEYEPELTFPLNGTLVVSPATVTPGIVAARSMARLQNDAIAAGSG